MEGLLVFQPQTGLRTLTCVATSHPLPSSHIPGAPILFSAFCHIQREMPETENLVLGVVPCPSPAVWGQWLHTARCPPGAMWKVSGSPPMSACPEHRNSGQTWAFSLSPLFHQIHASESGASSLFPGSGATQEGLMVCVGQGTGREYRG